MKKRFRLRPALVLCIGGRAHGGGHHVQCLGDGPQARVRLCGYREGLADPLRQVRVVAEQQRHDAKRHGQTERVLRVVGVAPVAQRGEDVVPVGPQHRQPAQLVAGQQPGRRLAHQAGVVRGVPPPQFADLATGGQLLRAVLTDRLQHPQPRPVAERLQQRLVDQ